MKKPVVIIGAGLAGLAAGYALGDKAVIFEAGNKPGGMAGTFNIEGFRYDLGPHVLYFTDRSIKRWVEYMLDGSWKKQTRRATISIDGEMVSYPFQEGFLRCDRLKKRYLPGLLNSSHERHGSFTEQARNLYGEAMAAEFFLPYNRKLWRFSLEEMDKASASRFLPAYPVEDFDKGDKTKVKRGPNAEFYYPTQGGIGNLAENIKLKMNARLILGAAITSINTDEKWVETQEGERHHYSCLISTIALPGMMDITLDLPPQIKNQRDVLKSVGMVFVHLGLKKRLRHNSHWVYYPREDLSFHRISIPENFNHTAVPPGCGSVVAEVSFPSNQDIDIQEVVLTTRQGMTDSGLLSNQDEIVSCESRCMKYAYVFPTTKSLTSCKSINRFLRRKNVSLAGRYASWEYGNMESAIIQGFQAAEAAC